jgi:Tfp pilus assembly protein PilX
MNQELKIKNTDNNEGRKESPFSIIPNSYSLIHRQSGFAMLFSVLVSSLILSVGLSIFNLTLKELVLSSSGRESQFAFFAADSGAECALYWEFKGVDIFATSTSSRTPNPATPQCNLQNINITPTTSDGTSATTQFSFTLPPADAGCSAAGPNVIVTVSKVDNAGIISTTIDSRGYNTCVTTDTSRVERGLRIRY